MRCRRTTIVTISTFQIKYTKCEKKKELLKNIENYALNFKLKPDITLLINEENALSE